MNKSRKITDAVIKDLETRSKKGKEIYGEYLKAFNGRNALQDLYEELLDACQYLKQRLIEEENSDYSSIEDAYLDLSIKDTKDIPETLYPKIKVNKIKCMSCGDIAISTHRHHMCWCKCGECAADGGNAYLRRAGGNWEELTEYEDA